MVAWSWAKHVVKGIKYSPKEEAELETVVIYLSLIHRCLFVRNVGIVDLLHIKDISKQKLNTTNCLCKEE